VVSNILRIDETARQRIAGSGSCESARDGIRSDRGRAVACGGLCTRGALGIGCLPQGQAERNRLPKRSRRLASGRWLHWALRTVYDVASESRARTCSRLSGSERLGLGFGSAALGVFVAACGLITNFGDCLLDRRAGGKARRTASRNSDSEAPHR
jgi:hypothetical protein